MQDMDLYPTKTALVSSAGNTMEIQKSRSTVTGGNR